MGTRGATGHENLARFGHPPPTYSLRKRIFLDAYADKPELWIKSVGRMGHGYPWIGMAMVGKISTALYPWSVAMAHSC